MLRNGFGEHNIQGIGDKHIPLIHNVLNTDVALAVSDRATDRLGVLFGTDTGRSYLARPALGCGRSSSTGSTRSGSRASATSSGRSRPPSTTASARRTSSSRSRPTAPRCTAASASLRSRKYFPDGFDEVERRRGVRRAHARRRHRRPSRAHARRARADLQPRLLHLGRAAGHLDRASSRPGGSQSFWTEMRKAVDGWDELIAELNARTGVLEEL